MSKVRKCCQSSKVKTQSLLIQQRRKCRHKMRIIIRFKRTRVKKLTVAQEVHLLGNWKELPELEVQGQVLQALV